MDITEWNLRAAHLFLGIEKKKKVNYLTLGKKLTICKLFQPVLLAF